MTTATLTAPLDQKNTFHRQLYNQLADEYKKRTADVLANKDLQKKALALKALSPGNKALEIGIGGGLMSKLLTETGFSMTGLDIAEKMVEHAKSLNPDGNYLVGDYAKMHFRNNYDMIIALAFIHLFTTKEAEFMLKKMYHELKEGGILHLTTTQEKEDSYDLYCKEDYGKPFQRYRAKYTPNAFCKLLADSPFRIQCFEQEEGMYGKKRMAITAKK